VRRERRRDLCGELQLVQRERGVVVCLGMYGDDKKESGHVTVYLGRYLYRQNEKQKRTS